MTLAEAIALVERMIHCKVELAAAERTSAYSKRIGAQHGDDVIALQMLVDAAQGKNAQKARI